MRELLSSGIALLTTALCAFVMYSCGDDDVYNPNAVVESTIAEYEANWEDTFGEIDADQDWNMAVEMSATMSIYEDALTTYYMQLYTANPLLTDSAYLLASHEVTTDASGYASVTFNVDIPDGTEELYAARKDSKNRRIVKAVDITGGSIEVQFGTSSSASAKTRSGSTSDAYEIPDYSCPLTDTDDVEEYISEMTHVDAASFNDYIAGYAGTEMAIIIGSGTTWDLPYFYYGYEYSGSMEEYSGMKKIVMVVEDGGTLNFNQNNIYTTSTYIDASGSYAYYEVEVEIIVESGGEMVMNNSGQLSTSTLYVLEGGEVTGGALNSGTAGYDTDQIYGIYNAGTIDVDNMYLANTIVDNCGVIIVEDNIQCSINGRLINNGKVYCNSFGDSSNQDGEIWTNCLFYCKEFCKGSNFRIGPGAAIESLSIQVYGYLSLDDNAILRAWDELLLGNCEISAPSETFALVSTEYLYMFDDMGTSNDICGNVWIEYNSIRDGADGYWQGVLEEYAEHDTEAYGYTCNLTNVGGSSLSIAGSSTIDTSTISAAECSGSGNEGTEEQEIEETPMVWTIACEDLGDTDDYDFNDIVFTVEHVSGETYAIITPWAAGGELESYIMYDGEEVNGETHEWIDANATKDSDGFYDMLNTSSLGTPGEEVEITVGDDFTMADDMGGFSVMVDGTTTVTITAPSAGSAPQMLLIDSQWAWPKERVSIKTAYPDFADWNTDDTSTDWVDSMIEDYVIELTEQ